MLLRQPADPVKPGNKYHLSKYWGVNVHQMWGQWFTQVAPYLINKNNYYTRPKGNQGGKKLRPYMVVMSLDTEVSRLPNSKDSFCYQWQVGYDTTDLIMGHTWDDLYIMLATMAGVVPDGCQVVIYVQNLSYEFQFLKGLYRFKPDEVLVLDPRKILKCNMFEGKIELRCSLLLTNMGLAAASKKFKVKHFKQSGDAYNYKKVRYPWDLHTLDEIKYDMCDVIGLNEIIKALLERDGDTLYTIPLTSTGYVRREAKKVMRNASYYEIRDSQPSWELYQLCREEFRGGNCHANRFYAGRIHKNIRSFDRSSSYPDVICNCKFPVGKFLKHPASYDEFYRLLKLGRACIARVTLYNVRLKKYWWGCPYIARAKCSSIAGGVWDNGRVLACENATMVINDIDLKIILDEYKIDEIHVDVLYSARYDYLPGQFIRLVEKFYEQKTTLKGVDGQELYYDKSKALLNALYGMLAQDPGKLNCLFQAEDEEHPYIFDGVQEDIFFKNIQRAFVSYVWGCWVTSWARLRLEEGIKLVGQNFVYADTDSVKYIDCPVDWDSYNNKRRSDSTRSGAYADDPAGIRHYMGVFEEERPYMEFITLGAKKYAYKQSNKKTGIPEITITVSGVQKVKGGAELGDLKNFAPDFVFSSAAGSTAYYNDHVDYTVEVQGHPLHIIDNVTLEDSFYHLGITQEYEDLITGKMDNVLARIIEYGLT